MAPSKKPQKQGQPPARSKTARSSKETKLPADAGSDDSTNTQPGAPEYFSPPNQAKYTRKWLPGESPIQMKQFVDNEVMPPWVEDEDAGSSRSSYYSGDETGSDAWSSFESPSQGADDSADKNGKRSFSTTAQCAAYSTPGYTKQTPTRADRNANPASPMPSPWPAASESVLPGYIPFTSIITPEQKARRSDPKHISEANPFPPRTLGKIMEPYVENFSDSDSDQDHHVPKQNLSTGIADSAATATAAKTSGKKHADGPRRGKSTRRDEPPQMRFTTSEKMKYAAEYMVNATRHGNKPGGSAHLPDDVAFKAPHVHPSYDYRHSGYPSSSYLPTPMAWPQPRPYPDSNSAMKLPVYDPTQAPPPPPTEYGTDTSPPDPQSNTNTPATHTRFPKKPRPGKQPIRPYAADDEIVSHDKRPDEIKSPLYGKLLQSEVRLIRIWPFASGLLKLTLLPMSINKPPPYTALSYAWGDSKDGIEIELNGQPYSITSNLHEALRVLQTRDRDVLCWVDALAINQKDQIEVTAQVQMMREIYSTASSVTIWLGPSSSDSDMALDLLDSISKHISAGNDNSLRQLIESVDSRPSFIALVTLFERDYWRRLWVVQEVLNAKYITVVCGSSVVPWATYQRATNGLRRHSSYIDRNYASWQGDGAQPLYVSSKARLSYSQVLLQLGPATFKDVESLSSSESNSDAKSIAQKFMKALCMCRSKFSTNPRDKVYGLLGVVPVDVQKHVVPDYSLSIKDVFTNTAEYIISATGRVDVLGNAFHFPVHMTALGLPSWVPDWSHISPMSPVDWPLGRFTAAADTNSDTILDNQHHRVLNIKAISIDKVGHRGVPVGTINTVDDFVMSFMHWFAILQGHLRGISEEQRLRAEEAFCRILTLDNSHPLYTSPDIWRLVTFHLFASLAAKNLPELPLHPRLTPFAKEGCVELHSVSRNSLIQETFSPGMTGRSFFFTTSGVMGMGSGYLAVGDMAVVPFGCSTPLLLRSDGDEGEYRLVGDAYLDGYMYGQAIKDWSNGTSKSSRFSIH